MPKVKPELFAVLNDARVESVLAKLYRNALKQGFSLLMHFLPKAFQIWGRGIDWKNENAAFYDDKYVPIHPEQGSFLYLQARALGAKKILEFGTSYGISTLYLAKAAKDNQGSVITTEYLPQKVQIARQNFEEAGLAEYIELREGDARESLLNLDHDLDFVLLDGWPDLVFSIFRIIEPRLKKGAVIVVDDVEGFKPSMQDYLDYVRDPANGYLSSTIKLKKGLEYTIKLK
ncbi:MAG: class I SAM-dependent methyltransferase [Bacteroidota bacterium]